MDELLIAPTATVEADRDTEPQPLYQAAPDTDCMNAEELAPIIDDLGGLPNAPGGTTPGGTTSGGTTPGGTTLGGPIVTPTAYDFDGDRVVNAFDPSPRGETSQHLAGFGGNWSSELGTTYDTTATTDYILQGPAGRPAHRPALREHRFRPCLRHP